MNEKILPDSALAESVMEQIAPRRRRALRPAVVMAVVMVLILAATPVMAECLPWILEQVAPQLAQKLEPVQRSVTNNGITLEVVAASVRGNQAELVVRIEGEALKEPAGVAPDLITNREGLKSGTFHSIGDYEGVEEDRANGIYYYQVLMTYRHGMSLEEILAGEMTVTLDGIRVSGFDSEMIEVPVVLSDEENIQIIGKTELKNYGYTNLGGTECDVCRRGSEFCQSVIKPTGKTVYDVTDKLGLTAAAYIDGKLHILMRSVDNGGRNVAWGYWGPYLVDGDGNRAECLHQFYFNQNGVRYIGYTERVFDISPEELENYTMMVQLEYIREIPVECEVTFHFTEDEVTVE